MGTNIPDQRHPLRRPGCVLGLFLWFIVLLLPCFLIMLAARGELSITTGSAPEQRLRVWLIQEVAQSGIGISTAGIVMLDDKVCVQTKVNFILWQGQAEPTQYCECYVQTGADFQLADTYTGSCRGE
jgi:hypothetical protein